MRSQFIIVTKIVGKDQYIELQSSSALGNNHVVSYSINKGSATVFDTLQEAESFKENICNPYNRVFSIEEL